MLGYVVPEKAELKMREYEVYSAYYCGICKSVGERYGQLPRFTLNYDFVFLALLLAATDDETDKISSEHCIIHHIKKKNVLKENAAMDYAGDVMLILAYYKLMDDYVDDHSYPSRMMAMMLSSTVKRLSKYHSSLCELVESQLRELSKLEKEQCAELDRAEEPFARIMEAIFTSSGESNPASLKILKHIGYHLGKWIYLMDAYDDIEENITKNTYNPLLYRFQYEGESIEDFKEKIKPTVEFNLMHYLAEISNAMSLLDLKKNKGILENIAYFGLLRKTEITLEKGETNEQSV
ncbi:DUF5685 family protein [Clostridium aminobutyricum]|uniref:Uncharacterized protein n=1 Tax=Clostridium aminobutyricum TaxID=33953 RepID=A0A939IK00_CLOAM|nr:DUF5685 family protein [Clostridium aminobutyricum]MBN7774626.1 hypothetical protein [Clostridium aminobutyricum]